MKIHGHTCDESLIMASERTAAGKAYESGVGRGELVLASHDGDLQTAVGDLYSSGAPPQCSAPLHATLGKEHVTSPIHASRVLGHGVFGAVAADVVRTIVLLGSFFLRRLTRDVGTTAATTAAN